MPNNLDAVFFVQEPPKIEIRCGMVHICFDIGKRASFEVVMSPANYIKMRKLGGSMLDAFHEGCQNVFAIKTG